jgi:hypothetical protein
MARASVGWGVGSLLIVCCGVTPTIFGQPVSFLISSDDVIVGTWYGAAGEDDLRAALDYLVTVG